MKQVTFEVPLSDSGKWEGRFYVSATTDGQDTEIDQVVFEDAKGNKADVTEMVVQWANNLYDHLCEAAVNDYHNDYEDYTGDDFDAQTFRDNLNKELLHRAKF